MHPLLPPWKKDWMCVGNWEMERALQGKLGWEKWVMGSNSMGNLEGKFKEHKKAKAIQWAI